MDSAWAWYLQGELLLEAAVDDAVARASFERALAMREKLGDRRSVARTLWQLARVAERQGDDEAVHALYERGLAIYRDVAMPNDYGQAGLLATLGRYTALQGGLTAAPIGRYFGEHIPVSGRRRRRQQCQTCHTYSDNYYYFRHIL